MQGIVISDLDHTVLSMCKELQMEEKMKTKVKKLSGGTRRKTNMAIALIGNEPRMTIGTL